MDFNLYNTSYFDIIELGLTSYGSNLVVIQKNQNKINKANFSLQNIIFFTTLLLITISFFY